MYVENTLFVSCLLLLNATESDPPVAWMGAETPKFQTSRLLFTVVPPLKALVPLVSVELWLRVENR